MKRIAKSFGAVGIAFGACSLMFAANTTPSVSVSGVTASSPVLRSTAGITVSATVTPTYDTGSGPTTVTTTCKSNGGNNNCGTGNPNVTDQTVAATTTITISNQKVTASASDGLNTSAPVTLSGTAYSDTLTTPVSGTDGKTTVTVSASVSEDVTTSVTTVTTNQNCTSSRGVTTCTTIDASTTNSSSTATKIGSGTGTGSYILDINRPMLTLHPVASQPSVLQGQDKNIHNEILGGSANTAYTLTDTATGPGGYTTSADGNGTFGPSSGGDGIAPKENDLVNVHIACDAPVGIYTARAVANTVDLGGNPFAQINSVDTADNKPAGSASDTFQVEPGILLSDQTQVVSEFSGDYSTMSCFTSGTSGRKVTTFPGSLHITATVNTTGPCSGFGTISGTIITLTLPVGFSFDTTGASPAAHVFVGPAASGFDLHNPQTLAEVTGLISKPKISGQTVTIDLSTLNLGQGVGVLPSSDTIYVRAHAVFSGGSVPADGTQYVFTTSTTSTLPGLGSTTNTSSAIVTASSACVNGGN